MTKEYPDLNKNIFIPTWIWMTLAAAFACACGSFMVWNRMAGGYWILALSAYPLLIAVSYFLAVVFHEIGHFIAAKAVGLGVSEVGIGTGAVRWQFRFLGANWKFAASPFNHGYTQIYPGPPAGLRGKMIIMNAAGPLASAALFAALWIPVRMDPDPLIQAFNQHKTYVLFIIPALTNLLLFGTSVVPRVYEDGQGTDGRQLLDLLGGTHPLLRTTTWRELKNSPERESEILARREELKQPHLPDDYRRFRLDEFATFVIMLDAREYLGEARAAAEELCRLLPRDATAKASLGGVMVEQGEHEAGKRLLLEIIDADLDAFNKSIIAAYLALAEHRAGDKTKASDWLKRSAAYDSACIPLQRIRAAIEAST